MSAEAEVLEPESQSFLSGDPLPAYLRARYPVDRILAALLLILLLPVLAVLTIAIRLESPGPAFFRQWRIGYLGRPFRVVKLRTMYLSAPAFSVKVDSRSLEITPIGRFLRRSCLDEIPQLWNVVRGDMVLIGPRPEQAAIWYAYSEPWQRERHLVKPGITGWWQVHHRDDTPLLDNVEKDLYYITAIGPRTDARIVVKTVEIFLKGLRGRRAVRIQLHEAAEQLGLAEPESS